MSAPAAQGAGGPPRGIYAMLYAFFGADGGLDREAMRRQVELCIAGGAHGIAVLGLATEVGKLTLEERHRLLAWAAEDVAGRRPLAVTVTGATVEDQVAFLRAVEAAGASWAILQPPAGTAIAEDELVRFFGAVADRAALPVGIQNAPAYIGYGLGPQAVLALRRNHPNVTVLKGEGPAVEIAEIIAAAGGELAVFNGRGGLELIDNLRAGCAGVIPSPDCVDIQARIFELMAAGAEDEAERLYREMLPLVTFTMQSVAHLVCYGKRVTARRLGLAAVHDRAPALALTAFGLTCVERYAAALPRLGAVSRPPLPV
ncbi:MAG: dihydrodipicolinate synthase family protein [Rhodospirillaceae bacterium]|nr:dihydrodipicolinate synthase family protein [Rhodospirillaceae bacterium]